jgi:phospholipid transport system substrate-binding protein
MTQFIGLRFCSSLLLLLSLAFFGSVSASTSEADGATDVRQVVEQNVASMLQVYETEKVHFESDPQRFYRSMDDAISNIVDFKRIAARVMGKYARLASKEQRGQFTQVFKDSLFNTYTKTLVESGKFKINVTKAELNSRSDSRASVDMDVISDSGNVYPVTYSMYKNKEGQWLMENVIVFGVNVGLAFKDKFEAQYRASKGDITAVINGWTVDIELKAPETAATVAKEG